MSEKKSLLAEQTEARNAMPDAVRAARDKARAAIDREGGPMTPWGLDMCAVLDSLDDWERSASAPPPAGNQQTEAGATDEKLPAVVDRFGECLMCGHVYGAVVPEPVAEAARRYTKAVWAHEHCGCVHQECAHMLAKRVAAYEVANAVVAVKGVKRG